MFYRKDVYGNLKSAFLDVFCRTIVALVGNIYIL